MWIKSHISENIVPTGSVVKYLLEKLEETGNDIALIDCTSGEIWNGNKVHESVLRCTSGLKEVVGMKKGDVVCVHSLNSGVHSIAFMSIIALGGIHVACSPKSTLRELLNLIVDTETRYMICLSENIDIVKQAIKECGKNIGLLVFADEDVIDSNGTIQAISFNKLLRYETKIAPIEANDEDIATLMMTSGSTGIPKHIIRTHMNLKTMAIHGQHDEVFGQIRGKDVLSGHIPLVSDVGYFVILHSICSNVPVVLQPGFDPFLFMKSVDKYKITSAFLPPAGVVNLIDYPIPDGYDLSSLVNVVSGGSSMPKYVPDMLRIKLPNLKLRACYGSTETGNVTIVYKCDREASSFYTTIPTVGKPYPGVRLKIIDPQTHKSVPVGNTGEICVSGNVVTPGYYNSSLAHEELFVDGNFFRTGDAGFCDSDGNVYIVARIKDVIKVSGDQVSPAELEFLLMSHEDVLEAAVIGISHEKYIEVPKAFVVLKNGRKCEKETLLEWIKNQVSSYKKLFGGITFVDDLPKSSLGKVQKSKLRLL